jgi:hypothetical protein
MFAYSWFEIKDPGARLQNVHIRVIVFGGIALREKCANVFVYANFNGIETPGALLRRKPLNATAPVEPSPAGG